MDFYPPDGTETMSGIEKGEMYIHRKAPTQFSKPMPVPYTNIKQTTKCGSIKRVSRKKFYKSGSRLIFFVMKSL